MSKQPISSQHTSPVVANNNTINKAAFSNIAYLSCLIESAYEKRLPAMQEVLDEGFATIERNSLDHSELGKSILEIFDKAQEQLCQAGESASMINNHLGGSTGDALLAEKQSQLMENALAVLNKGISGVVEGIKNAVTLLENYQPETEAPEEVVANIALPEESDVATSWLRVPRWLKQLFAYKEEDAEQPVTTPEPVKVTSQTLYTLREALGQIYNKACTIADGEHSSLHRGDIVNALYESISTTVKPSPTSD
jgi:hypothetical protein